MEKIDDVTKETMEELSGRAASDETFRSVKTGYSFYDLYYRFELIRENVLSDIFAEILDKKLQRIKTYFSVNIVTELVSMRLKT